MTTTASEHRSDAQEELEKIPSEFLPAVTKFLRAFREGVTLPNARDSFQQGWREASSGESLPVSELWDDVDAE